MIRLSVRPLTAYVLAAWYAVLVLGTGAGILAAALGGIAL